MTVNYAESYARELANAYPYVLYSGRLWSTENDKKYTVQDAKTIKILGDTQQRYIAEKEV